LQQQISSVVAQRSVDFSESVQVQDKNG